ncbi:MAG: hypothetical protein ACK53X_01320 [Holosporales bacterium]|jgi:hypothetical protein
MSAEKKSQPLFGTEYPYVDKWVQGDGWIEIGYDYNTKSFIRVLDEGGMIWSGRARYTSVDEALAEANCAIGEWLENN